MGLVGFWGRAGSVVSLSCIVILLFEQTIGMPVPDNFFFFDQLAEGLLPRMRQAGWERFVEGEVTDGDGDILRVQFWGDVDASEYNVVEIWPDGSWDITPFDDFGLAFDFFHGRIVVDGSVDFVVRGDIPGEYHAQLYASASDPDEPDTVRRFEGTVDWTDDIWPAPTT